MTKKLLIEGMSCNHCVMHVTNALQEVKGVNKVDVSLKNKTAIVELSQDVNDDELKNAVVDCGYQVISIE